MPLPTIAETGRLTHDPEIRYSQNGTAIATISLAFNERRFNKDTQQREDGAVCYLRGSILGPTAEAVSQQLTKGALVMVKGALATRTWTDREGQNRSSIEVRISDIGAVVREPAPKPAVDAWGTPASAAPANAGGGGYDAPPF